jgi:CHASE2 domain-containing sensor protein
LRTALRRLSSRPGLLAAVAVGAALLALLSYESGALNGLERETIDARFDIRGGKTPSHGIVIVGVDQKTLTALNERPPISRTHYARLLDRLHAADPRLIAIDVQFIGGPHRPGTRALLQSIARNGPVLLATHDAEGGPIAVPAGQPHAKGAVLASAAVDTDSDNVVRRMMYAPVAVPTFAVRAAELVTGAPVDEGEFPANHAWIDFHGPPGTYPTYSFIDVLKGRVSSSALRRKLVLVGVTDPAGKDVFVTAASSYPMAGVEIQANALNTILDGFPLQPLAAGIEIALILGLAATPALLAIRLPAIYMALATLGTLLLFLLASQLAFNSGWIVPVVDPILALVLSAAGAATVDFLVERRQRRALESTLSRLPGDRACDFFISYRRDQSGRPAQILKDELAKRFGEDSVFMDVASLDAGQEWPRRLEEAIRESAVVLVLIGPDWLHAANPDGTRRLDDPRDWVRLEIETGLREQDVVVPVLTNNARMPTEEELPDSIRGLARRNAFWLTMEPGSAQIDELVDSIRDGRVRDFLAKERSKSRRAD